LSKVLVGGSDCNNGGRVAYGMAPPRSHSETRNSSAGKLRQLPDGAGNKAEVTPAAKIRLAGGALTSAESFLANHAPKHHGVTANDINKAPAGA
jgi:hypothetical protein